MARNQNDRPDRSEKKTDKRDLTDSPRDQERLEPDEASLDLPDVKDIPGQEFIHVPRLGELADTTISSDDEEGARVFGDDTDDETLIAMGTEGDIPKEDRAALETGDHTQFRDDDQGLRRSALDRTDVEGERLNESFDRTGEDLDVPGAEADNREEAIGEEDEENNPYSLGSDSNDEMTEGTP